MKKHQKHAVCLNFLLLLTLNCVSGQSLEHILEKHDEAIGAKNMRNIQSVRYKGKFDNSYLKDFVVNKNLDEKALYPKFDLSVINNQAYSLQIDGTFGKEAYTFSDGNYWRDQGGAPPEQWAPSSIERLRIQLVLDIDGFLCNWKGKGFVLKKLDDVVLDNIKYHRLILVTPEKDSLFYYLNPQTYLISKISFFHDLSENPKSPSYSFAEYRKVKGFLIPVSWFYKTQMFNGPNGYQEMKIERIKLNPKINKKIFSLKHRMNKTKPEKS
jgi:hypothetical protein